MLVFVPPVYLPDVVEEKERYETHNNDPLEPGYQEFLNRLLTPFSKKLKQGQTGLDFGCGPTKTAEVLLADQGLKVESYDPFFFPGHELLLKKWDFIVASEVAEHFHKPAESWTLLSKIIQPGGMIGVMTTCYPVQGRFERWRYKDDNTHVVFYSPSTFQWISEQFGFELEEITASVFIMKKKN
jgi:2-polyprenyl-3-methyl-5-hydroxy-6-metoxy-1,4-benzoquinol methylase